MITLYNEKDEKIKLISVFEFNDADMGESSLSATISFDKEQNFHPDWYVIYNGEKFRLGVRKPTGKKDTSSLQTSYTLVFKSEREDLKRYTFMDFVELGTGNPQPNSYMVSLYATLSEFVDRFNVNLSYYMGERWKMVLPSDYIEDGKFVSITFDNMSLWDVLLKVYEIWGVRWRIAAQDRVLNIQVGFPADEINHIFEYGKDNGLVSIERNNSLERIITRLRGRGGEKNLPASYFHSGDPDTNSFLQATFFKNLMPKSYRDYIRGYNAGSGTGSWAYNQGVADKVNGRVISPVDYVISDKEDLWGISYGAIEPNEYIFPTLQGIERDGSRLDTVIAVEEVLADSPDIKSDKETEIVDDIEIVSKGVYSPGGDGLYPSCIDPIELKESVPFFISKPYSSVDLKFRVDSLTMQQPSIGWTEEVFLGSDVMLSGSIVLMNTDSAMVAAEVDIANDPSAEIHAENIEPGNYSFRINLQWKSSSKPLGTIVTCEFSLYDIKIDQYSSPALKDGFKSTFDIWVKDIWNIPRNSDETDEDYTYRVWSPLAVSEEMTVMFSDGLLAGEDYEFRVVGVTADADNLRSVIVDAIHPDTSKTFNGEQSAWRLKLEKSEAEVEASGRYLPNSKQNAKAGDHFFFVNIAMPYDPYVYEAEARVEAYLDEQLSLKDKEFPSFTMAPSSIFCKDFAEVDKLKAGSTIRVRNTSLIGDSPISLHIQSITKRYSDNKLNPDWTITLSDQIVATGSPVEILEGNINILASQVYSNKEAVKQAIKQLSAIFLRKDGIDDVSYSPTIFKDTIKFDKDISDVSFDRAEGKGFGVYTDANGNRVVEADILIGRKGGGGGSGTVTTLGSLLNVDSLVDTASAEDVILSRAANSNLWGIKKLSELAGLDESALADYLSANGYITESVLNGKAFATQSWVIQQDYLSEVTAQDIYNALGYTPASTDEISKAALIATLGIADWALAASKPSYAFSEITGKPTTLAGYGITDNVAYCKTWNDLLHDSNEFTFAKAAHAGIIWINYRTASGLADGAITEYRFANGAGRYYADIIAAKYVVDKGTSSQFLKADGSLDSTDYLPKSGGILDSGSDQVPLILNSKGVTTRIAFTQSDTILGYLGFDAVNNPVFIYSTGGARAILHADNYSNYALPLSGGTLASSSFNGALEIHRTGSAGACAIKFSNDVNGVLGSIGIGGSSTDTAKLQPFWTDGPTNYTLIHAGNIGEQSVNYATSAASATKLQTARTIWGQSFDGTGDVNGDISTVVPGTAFGVGPTVTFGIQDRGKVAAIKGQYDNVDWSSSNPASGSLRFYTSQYAEPTEKMCITSGGNVLIGTSTEDYYSKLLVNGSIASRGDFQLISNSPSTTSNSGKLKFNALDTDVAGPYIQAINAENYGRARLGIFQHNAANYSSATEVMSIMPNGNVLIGTTTDAGYKLDVNGDVKSDGFVSSTIDIEKDNQTGEINRTSGKLYLQFNNYNHLILCQGGGYVGIGTATPAYRLDVSGTGRFTGSLTIGGATLTWDSTNNCLRVNTNLATDGELTAGGVSDDDSTDTGVSYNRLDSWDAYNAGAGDVLSATLGYGLKNDIVSINNNISNLQSQIDALGSGSGGSVSGDYLPLTGGTLTGSITVKGTNIGYMWARESDGAALGRLETDGENLRFRDYNQLTSGGYHTIITNQNIGDYAIANTGGEIYGDLYTYANITSEAAIVADFISGNSGGEFSGDVYIAANLFVDGEFNHSDMRYKDVLENIYIPNDVIADAPIFRYRWADKFDNKLHIGTSAQYWEEYDNTLVSIDPRSGKLGLNYISLAVAMGQSNANEIRELKKEIVKLKERLAAYEQ